ncbi:MAG TPA: DUF87 domain-containing protein [Candidatus Thermoplasmatota archaeon]|nr:DUF87 domain-containing protein [Candidatus Thermoplasmatota archaeon]
MASEGEELGRIIGDSVTHLQFRCRNDRDVFVGDLVVAEDEATGTRFLFRVTNVRHGAEAMGPDWMARTAGAMIAMDDHGQEHRLHEADQRLYKVGLGVPLGYVKEGAFRKAKSLAPHFGVVRRAASDDYKFLAEFMGDIEVGYLRSGETHVAFPVGIDGAKSFPYHVGIFATTGMGKSNLMKVLAGSALERGRYGVLLVDPHGEYYDGGAAGRKGLRDHPAAPGRLSVYSTRDLKGPHHRLTFSAHEIETTDILNLFEMSSAQKDFIDAARGHYGPAWIVELGEKTEAQVMAEVPGRFHEGTVAVVKRKLRRLVRNGMVHKDAKVTVTKPILADLRAGKVVLVDSSGLTEAEELLVSTVLARFILEENKKLFGDAAFDAMPPVLITLEEAQRVLGGGEGRQSVFAQIAREGRKFKTGLCAITQQPKLLDREVVSQFNTLFIMGLADKRDRDILQDSAKQDVSALENEIQMLMPGEVLITSPYAPFAVPGLVHLYERHLETRPKRDEPAPAARPPPADFY